MRRTTWVWIALAVSLAAAALFFAERWRRAEARIARLERLSTETTERRVFLDPVAIAELETRGLEGPVEALRADLAARGGGLIPFEGEVGGQMAFYDKAGMIFLPGGYVYAPGDDGHVLVHALLRYEVAPGGKILWKLVDARRD